MNRKFLVGLLVGLFVDLVCWLVGSLVCCFYFGFLELAVIFGCNSIFRSKEEWKLWDIYLRIGQFSSIMSSQNLDKKRIKLLANSIVDPIVESDNWYVKMKG